MSDAGQYTSRYFTGMKVEVGIPLPDSKVFRDWAIISEIDEDLVSLQLSRDMLPAGVNLRVGQILTIRSESDGQAYSCRAFIVSKGYEQDLLLRLTGEIVFEETVVTASKGVQSPLDAASSTSIITEQDIRLSGITKIPELLRHLAGVDIMEVTGGDTQVSLRGFNQPATVANRPFIAMPNVPARSLDPRWRRHQGQDRSEVLHQA